ncbi:hypothetical protein FA95DRAFT_896693 [Auriscalpium vulgare]|uniref:Uncharacterized protein n=1 Tax=Auriscalpium vulgare TaxID=40419 RepID=A0ACB8RZT7_9AGAM|nr:hypothetical protein FA95DRAFT_896693 [Auriscalpium vulgare]
MMAPPSIRSLLCAVRACGALACGVMPFDGGPVALGAPALANHLCSENTSLSQRLSAMDDHLAGARGTVASAAAHFAAYRSGNAMRIAGEAGANGMSRSWLVVTHFPAPPTAADADRLAGNECSASHPPLVSFVNNSGWMFILLSMPLSLVLTAISTSCYQRPTSLFPCAWSQEV